jgi:hypothetical protein
MLVPVRCMHSSSYKPWHIQRLERIGGGDGCTEGYIPDVCSLDREADLDLGITRLTAKPLHPLHPLPSCQLDSGTGIVSYRERDGKLPW